MYSVANKSWLKWGFYLPAIASIFTLGLTNLAAEELQLFPSMMKVRTPNMLRTR